MGGVKGVSSFLRENVSIGEDKPRPLKISSFLRLSLNSCLLFLNPNNFLMIWKKLFSVAGPPGNGGGARVPWRDPGHGYNGHQADGDNAEHGHTESRLSLRHQSGHSLRSLDHLFQWTNIWPLLRPKNNYCISCVSTSHIAVPWHTFSVTDATLDTDESRSGPGPQQTPPYES